MRSQIPDEPELISRKSPLAEALVETSETPELAAATGNDAAQAHHVEPLKEVSVRLLVFKFCMLSM